MAVARLRRTSTVSPPQTGECAALEQGKLPEEEEYREPTFYPPPGCTPSRGASNTNSAQVRLGAACMRQSCALCA